MYRIGLNEKLLISQTGLSIISPWAYKIYEIKETTLDLITEDNFDVTEPDYIELLLTDGLFGSCIFRPMLLILINASSDETIEDGVFTIAGLENMRDEMLNTVGLLGENAIEDSSAEGAFQDGNAVESVITIYHDSALTIKQKAWDWTRRFSGDFIPDHRFHIFDESQS